MKRYSMCGWERVNTYRILVKAKQWRSFRRCRYKCTYNKMDFKAVRWESVDWIHCIQDRDQWWAFVNTAMSLWVPWKVWNFFITSALTSFSRTFFHANQNSIPKHMKSRLNWGMLVTMQFRIFGFLIWDLKSWRSKYTKLILPVFV
jgi:hypothetical protein